MSLNIFVLEDDFIQQARLEKAIRGTVAKTDVTYRQLAVFGKPQQLLDAIKECGNHQVYFLDIEIKADDQKGLAVAQSIRQRDPNAVIVFVTTHSEFMPLTYKYRVSALDFIDKSLSENDYQEAICSVLCHAYHQIGRTISEDAFILINKHSHIQVPFSEILYFETSTTVHKVILVTKTGRLEFYGKVSEIPKIDSRLYQSHRAYVVNPANISRIDRAEQIVYFTKNHNCPVSRLKLKGLIERVDGRD